jgi:hypothetical protein
MYILQDGKLYIRNGKKIVGVEIYPDLIKKVKGTETEERPDRKLLSATDAWIKFHISEETPYIFPVEEKVEEVKVEDEPIVETKKRTRKSTSK